MDIYSRQSFLIITIVLIILWANVGSTTPLIIASIIFLISAILLWKKKEIHQSEQDSTKSNKLHNGIVLSTFLLSLMTLFLALEKLPYIAELEIFKFLYEKVKDWHLEYLYSLILAYAWHVLCIHCPKLANCIDAIYNKIINLFKNNTGEK